MSRFDQLTQWSLLVGFVSPLLIAAIQQPHWSNRVRALVTVVVSLVLGAGTAYFNGQFDGQPLATAVLIVFVAAVASYRNLWHPTGVARAIEGATSPKSDNIEQHIGG